MERDIHSLRSQKEISISTHTLTWSVTNMGARSAVDRRISTHTLTWSVTHGLSRARLVNGISTHTLTWSVTCDVKHCHCVVTNFNSHAHVERDLQRFCNWYKLSDFNSHAHVERDCINSDDWKRQCISTHTLTWSVTLYVCKLLPLFQFQLTRSRGA